MKMAFSTLACPDWGLAQIIQIASSCGYQGIELRFVENEDALYRLPEFKSTRLAQTKRALSDAGVSICCVDTSCRFHFPEASERAHWVEEGVRMAEVAAELEASGIRVFGDEIQAGADRESTRKWIADSIHELVRRIANTGVEVWLETHGDFASAAETNAILAQSNSGAVGVIWDPANCWVQWKERPREGAEGMGGNIRHVHIKDLRLNSEGWKPVLTGEGTFPLQELHAALHNLRFQGFVSFEWEKKWHPDIPDASIALPHFARWFRENWNDEQQS